jgi:hypothetical protein
MAYSVVLMAPSVASPSCFCGLKCGLYPVWFWPCMWPVIFFCRPHIWPVYFLACFGFLGAGRAASTRAGVVVALSACPRWLPTAGVAVGVADERPPQEASIGFAVVWAIFK